MKKTDKEILDEFGKEFISKTYDKSLFSIKQYIDNQVTNNSLSEVQEFKKLFSSLNTEQKELLFKFFKQQLALMMCSTLEIFDDRDYKIVYETEKQKVYLDKASMEVNTGVIQAEPIVENGWIEKFSKYVNLVSDEVLPRG